MAYSAPELLRVGAAQNLVLDTGSYVTDGKRDCPSPREQEDFGDHYDAQGLW